MAKYRDALPQLRGGVFLADGGLETDLIFNRGFDLPEFAAFHLLASADGRAALDDYYRAHAGIAVEHGAGFILDSATWRANPDWGAAIGYGTEELRSKNVEAVAMLEGIRREMETPDSPMVINGVVGPRGDGYVPGEQMSADEAADYHAFQIDTFATTPADMITAVTMNYVAEAVGVVRAANAAGMPLAVSFTVETDARLPGGSSLEEAIHAVDDATDGGPAYYMINCAHPSHFEYDLVGGGGWLGRIRGVRANASKRSHEELDGAPDLDAGDPLELAADFRRLTGALANLNVLGGCCGTDHRHIAEIAKVCVVGVGA